MTEFPGTADLCDRAQFFFRSFRASVLYCGTWHGIRRTLVVEGSLRRAG